MKQVKRYYFSRIPGLLVNANTGKPLKKQVKLATSIRQWYERLIVFCNEKAYEFFKLKPNDIVSSTMNADIRYIHECCLNYMMLNFTSKDYSAGLVKKQIIRLCFLDKNVPRNEIHIKANNGKKLIIQITDMDIV